MKIIGLNGSILTKTNKIVSSSLADWSGIREGAFIKFARDTVFYSAAKVEKKIYLKDFTVIDPKTLRVQENIGVNICEDDSLKISYKEYELETLHKIISNGKGYPLGERGSLSGGISSLNIRDNTLNPTIFEVTKVGDGGKILELKIHQRGTYLESPPEINSINSRVGSGASLEVSFKLIDYRTFIEKDVEKIEFKAAESYIHLSYPIPAGIKTGKLSVEKWEITLSSEYAGGAKFNQELEIIRDFTPNYSFPLLAKNPLSIEPITNRSLVLVDSKIAELEDRISKLEKQ